MVHYSVSMAISLLYYQYVELSAMIGRLPAYHAVGGVLGKKPLRVLRKSVHLTRGQIAMEPRVAWMTLVPTRKLTDVADWRHSHGNVFRLVILDDEEFLYGYCLFLYGTILILIIARTGLLKKSHFL